MLLEIPVDEGIEHQLKMLLRHVVAADGDPPQEEGRDQKGHDERAENNQNNNQNSAHADSFLERRRSSGKVSGQIAAAKKTTAQ